MTKNKNQTPEMTLVLETYLRKNLQITIISMSDIGVLKGVGTHITQAGGS